MVIATKIEKAQEDGGLPEVELLLHAGDSPIPGPLGHGVVCPHAFKTVTDLSVLSGGATGGKQTHDNVNHTVGVVSILLHSSEELLCIR